MIEDIKTALSSFFESTINIFGSLSTYGKTLISEIKNSIDILMEVVNEVPPIFRNFLILSIVFSVGFMVLNRGRVN